MRKLGAVSPALVVILVAAIGQLFSAGLHGSASSGGTQKSPLLVEARSTVMVKRFEHTAQVSWAKHLAGPYARIAVREAKAQHLPPLLVASVIHEENRGFLYDCANRVSPVGAIGPMQLMPSTAWSFLRINPWIPKENIAGGAKYLHYLVAEFHSIRLALIAYNAGPTQVAEGIHPQAAVYYASAVLKNAGLVTA